MNENVNLPPNYQFSIGDLAFAIRKINGLTQVDYSKRLGVVQSTVSKVEKNVFEDVPFSLVSKISSEFNIPLNYFQAGILPLKKTKNLKCGIPDHYLIHGIFKAKTIFYVLNEIEKKYGHKIYKDLKLPKQLLCLNNLYYSLEFIHKLFSLFGSELLQFITNISIQNKVQDTLHYTYQSIYEYLTSLHGIDLIEINLESALKSENKIYFSFPMLKKKNEVHEINLICAELLKLEMKIVFNATFSIKKFNSPSTSSLRSPVSHCYELEIL